MKSKAKERGLITLVSVLVIIIIITIITLSLASLSRRGLRQSLDEQLSSQALYAAESGINDVIQKLDANELSSDITDCNDINDPTKGFSPNLNAEGTVRYSCILVIQTSTTIDSFLTKNSLKYYPIEDAGGATINSLTINWTKPTGTKNITACSAQNCLYDSGGWSNRLGLLRVRLIPDVATADLDDRNAINNKSVDVIAYPFGVTGLSNETSVAAGVENYVLAGTCGSDSRCTINLNSIGNRITGKYYLQIYTYFNDANITITGNGGTASFKGAQITIDSTGVAQDVSKRLQVKIPKNMKSDLPVYSVGVGEKLCKRFFTNPTATDNDSSVTPILPPNPPNTVLPPTCDAFSPPF